MQEIDNEDLTAISSQDKQSSSEFEPQCSSNPLPEVISKAEKSKSNTSGPNSMNEHQGSNPGLSSSCDQKLVGNFESVYTKYSSSNDALTGSGPVSDDLRSTKSLQVRHQAHQGLDGIDGGVAARSELRVSVPCIEPLSQSSDCEVEGQGLGCEEMARLQKKTEEDMDVQEPRQKEDRQTDVSNEGSANEESGIVEKEIKQNNGHDLENITVDCYGHGGFIKP